MAWRRFLSLAGVLLILSGGPLLVRAQNTGPSDTVKYHDRTKDNAEATKLGEAKESAAGITIASTGKTVSISPADIISVYYGHLAGVEDRVRLDMPSWDLKGGTDALLKYTEALKVASTSGADEKTKRFLEFKVAMWAAKLAETKTGPEFKAEAAAAIDKLVTVARSYSKSWEVWPAFRTAAKLQAELGKYNDAAATLATLAKTDGLPAELKHEAKLAEVDVLFRSGSALAAAPVIDEVAKISSLSNLQKDRLAIYQTALKGAQDKTDPAKVQAAAKGVRELIDKMPDPVARASAYNVLGELYLMANLPRDAMWEFCWVEAVYNQDHDEVVKALERLAQIFESQGEAEKEHAAAYREKWLKAKGL